MSECETVPYEQLERSVTFDQMQRFFERIWQENQILPDVVTLHFDDVLPMLKSWMPSFPVPDFEDGRHHVVSIVNLVNGRPVPIVRSRTVARGSITLGWSE